MGLWDTVKGWFSSGVTAKLTKVENPFPRSQTSMNGEVTLTPKADKSVTDVKVKVIRTETKGSGAEKKTATKVFGEFSLARSPNGGCPFDVKANEPKVVPFVVPVSIPRALQEQKGVLGAIGKIGAFVDSDKLEYFIVTEVSVKGTLIASSDKVQLVVHDKE